MKPNRTKSRTYRRVKKRLPGGKTVTHYTKRKPPQARCGSCNGVLKGVPRQRPYKMRTMAKTKKRSERAYPNLCSKCSRQAIIANIAKIEA